MNFLTEDELIELTKAKQPQKQGQILDENGIYYIRRADFESVQYSHFFNWLAAIFRISLFIFVVYYQLFGYFTPSFVRKYF